MQIINLEQIEKLDCSILIWLKRYVPPFLLR